MDLQKKEQLSKHKKKLHNDASSLQQFVDKHQREFTKLTDREVKVLTLIAKGMEKPAIARKLHLSNATVQSHQDEIQRKLSIESQADYIKYALAFGLLSF